jgi:hypothetical protein
VQVRTYGYVADFSFSASILLTHRRHRVPAKPWCNASFGSFVAGVASGAIFFFSNFLLHFSSCFNIVSYLCPNFLFSDCNLSFSFLRCSTSERTRSNSCDRFNLRSSFSDRRRSTSKRKLKDSLDILAYSIHMPVISLFGSILTIMCENSRASRHRLSILVEAALNR